MCIAGVVCMVWYGMLRAEINNTRFYMRIIMKVLFLNQLNALFDLVEILVKVEILSFIGRVKNSE